MIAVDFKMREAYNERPREFVHKANGGEVLSRRARKREARRKEMLTVAMDIVERDGLEGLTIARLADALDAAVGALYRYFPGKDALLFSMQQLALDEFYEVLQDLLARTETLSNKEPGEAGERLLPLLKLLSLMQAYLVDAWEASARHRLIFEFMSSYDPSLSDEDAQKGEGAVLRILELVHSALSDVFDGSKTDEELWQATLIVWATVHGLDHFRKRDRLVPDHLHVNQLLPVAQRNMFIGWGLDDALINESLSWFAAHEGTLFPPGGLRIIQEEREPSLAS